jgi:histidinol-phosphate aminotransferase
MSLIDNIIRPDILALSAYAVPDAEGFIKLDAMENPYPLPDGLRRNLGERLAEVALNRYPVPTYDGLKAKIRHCFGLPAGFDVMLGNGSDELIAILSTACARLGAKVLAPVPGFVMYERSAQFAGLEFVGVPLAPGFILDMPAMLAAIRTHRPVITYLAYPNNPTGTLFDSADVEAILGLTGDAGIVVVDEAYQPFAETSFMPRLTEFDNLVVMRTVSKLGLAGLRLGYMAASGALLAQFDKVRPPYNVNVLSEAAADLVLDHIDILDAQAAHLRSERALLSQSLRSMPGIEVFPSAANFVLIRFERPLHDADAVFAALLARRVLVKNVGKMHALLDNCLRVTIGTPEENRKFLDALAASLAL